MSAGTITARTESSCWRLVQRPTRTLTSRRPPLVFMESSLVAGNTQVAAIRVDWAKWRQFFRSMQENPLLERILASVESQEGGGVTSDWRLKIEAAAP